MTYHSGQKIKIHCAFVICSLVDTYAFMSVTRSWSIKQISFQNNWTRDTVVLLFEIHTTKVSVKYQKPEVVLDATSNYLRIDYTLTLIFEWFTICFHYSIMYVFVNISNLMYFLMRNSMLHIKLPVSDI